MTKRNLEVSHIYQSDAGWFVVTSRDYSDNTFTAKYFDYQGDAVDWVHDISKAQCPSWHKENCPRCKNGEA